MDFEEEEATADTTETVEEPQTEEPTPATLPTDSGEDSTTAEAKPESSTALLEPTSTDDVPEEEVVRSKPISAPAAKSKVHDLFDDDDDEEDEPPTTTTTEPQVKVYLKDNNLGGGGV
jgi:hypothetical protein